MVVPSWKASALEVVEAKLSDPTSELHGRAVRGVPEDDAPSDFRLLRMPQHLQCELRLGLELQVLRNATFASALGIVGP